MIIIKAGDDLESEDDPCGIMIRLDFKNRELRELM